ncbi:dihydroneopterin aldolase [Coriobacterium glomerans PW2]|uniref:7,8-dihydroneopterin aldolase n=1 Tax=Coriobacterium glomerans (strain ATCC 49209 / DSM 20642 / JCM 10262 / PW2) TaxID=700015 RepID=F2N7H9_CORGP|nr:dihydroneopterin aldolase [Coriobacterium glomerans]AEB06795.1 dihydroneopterin aldolase [Coriobacterium glomerans PW2]
MTKRNLPESTSAGEARGLARRRRPGLSESRAAIVPTAAEQLAGADRIRIDGLEVFAKHGVNPAENELGQKFIVSATLYVSLRRAGCTDDLADTVDYGAVCHTIDMFLRARTCKLIEAAAEGLATELLRAYPALLGVRLAIDKPWAPIGLPLAGVSVEIERTR